MPAFVNEARRPLPHETQTNGCFETMRAYHRRIFRLEDHLDRLYASAAFLGTRIPANRGLLRRQLLSALATSGIREAVVRIALMPQPHGLASPSIVVQPVSVPPPSAYRRGLRVAVVPTRAYAVGAITPQAKYSARLGSVLAVLDAQQRGADEALFLDPTGYVTESTASNFGIVREGTILLPPCWLGLLAGITRDVLFELGTSIRVPVHETCLTRHELYNAQEAFLLSTLKEVMPVTNIDGRRIANGRPGPISKRLQRAFRQLLRRELHLP